MIEGARMLGENRAGQLNEKVKQAINDGTIEYMNERNMADMFLGNMEDTKLETFPQLSELENCRPVFTDGRDDSVFIRNGVKPLKDILRGYSAGHLSVVGPAGSGKSTLLKTISRNVIEKKYQDLSDVEIVIYIKCGDLDTSRKLPSTKFLLSLVHLEDNELKKFEKYAKKHPNKILFVLDGLDTFPEYFYKENISRKGKQNIGSDERKRAKDTLRALMEGKLFPHCRVITSSRDNTEFGQSRKNTVKVVNLSGLSEHSIQAITKQFLSTKQAKELISLLKEHPDLLDLCRTPMFLIFTLIVKKNEPEFSPSTMSEILLQLLNCLVRSPHSSLEERDMSDIGKFCAWLIGNDEVNFSRTDLSNHGISVDKIHTLVVHTPFRENQRIFFVHQSVAQIFASFHFLEMKASTFSSTIKKFLDSNGNIKQEFALIEQMLSGILLNELVYDRSKPLLKVDELEDKREVLKDHLRERINRLSCRNSPESDHPQDLNDLSLILSLNEAGECLDSIIESDVCSVTLQGFGIYLPLSVSDIRAIGKVIARCERLHQLSLNFWWLLDEHIRILLSCISGSPTKISRMELQGNGLTPDGMIDIGKLIRCCSVEEMSLAVSNYGVAAEPQHAVRLLKQSLCKYKLKALDLSFFVEHLQENEMIEENATTTLPLTSLKFSEQLMQRIHPIISITGVAIHEIQDSQVDLEKGTVKEKLSNSNGEQQDKYCLILPGYWREASTEFTMAVADLIANVEDRIDLYNWKFSQGEKDILQAKLNEDESLSCKIHLSQDQILSPSKMALLNETKRPTIMLNKIDEYFTMSKSLDWIRKFQLSHQAITTQQLGMLSKAFATMDELEEFELRNCNLDEHLMLKLLEILRSQRNTLIPMLSVTASKDLDGLFSPISEIMNLCKTRNLNIEEAEAIGNFLHQFLKFLADNRIDDFQLLNLNYISADLDYETLGKLICGKITDLKLVNCDVETDKLETMCSGMDEEEASLENLDLSYNPELVEQDIALLPNFLCKNGVKTLALRGCCLSSEEIQGLESPGFESLKVQELDLSYNDDLGSDGVEIVGKAVRKLSANKLSLGSCNLDEECLESLEMALLDHHLSHLELRDNTKIAPRSEMVGQLVIRCKAEFLDISDCKMTASQISDFAHTLKKSQFKLRGLNMSESERVMIDETFMKALSELLDVVGERLEICYPNLDENAQEMFKTFFDNTDIKSLKVIYEEPLRLEKLDFLAVVGTREERCL